MGIDCLLAAVQVCAMFNDQVLEGILGVLAVGPCWWLW